MTFLRLQADIPRDLSAELHRRLGDIRQASRIRNDYEMTNQERSELYAVSVRKGDPKFAGEFERWMRDHHFAVSPREEALKTYAKVPILVRALLRTADRYSDKELAEMILAEVGYQEA